MVGQILLALMLFSLIIGLAFWLGRGATAVVAFNAEFKGDAARGKRARAIAETKTATELWAAESRSEFEFVQLSVPSSPDMRNFLIAKHGDNIAAYDAWTKASKDTGGLGPLFKEMLAWRKNQKSG
jgi:hypothetical protein